MTQKKIGAHHKDALRNLRDEELRMIELDGMAPTDPSDSQRQFDAHLRAVRAVQAIDIVTGDERDYESLRWSASEAISHLPEEEVKQRILHEGVMDKANVVGYGYVVDDERK